MNGQQEKALQELTEDFMKASKYQSRVTNQSQYKDLHKQINAALTSQRHQQSLKHIKLLYNAAGRRCMVDFKPYIENETISSRKVKENPVQN